MRTEVRSKTSFRHSEKESLIKLISLRDKIWQSRNFILVSSLEEMGAETVSAFGRELADDDQGFVKEPETRIHTSH